MRRQIFGKVRHGATQPASPTSATGRDRENGFMIGGSHHRPTARLGERRALARENTFSIKAPWAAVVRTAPATKTTTRWSAAPRTYDRPTKYAENQPLLSLAGWCTDGLLRTPRRRRLRSLQWLRTMKSDRSEVRSRLMAAV